MPKYETRCPRNYEIDLYAGCSFGCVYCIARHHSSGCVTMVRDSETIKRNIMLANKEQFPVYLSPWSDAYQHAEKDKKRARHVIRALSELDCPFFVITRSSLVLRDIDILRNAKNSFVAISMNTLDASIIGRLEPHVAPITERMEVVRELINNNIRTVVKIDPIIPGLTDGNTLQALVCWLQEVKPYAVTAETLRLTKKIAQDLSHVLSHDEYGRMLDHYAVLEEGPQHPNLSYRLTLLRGIAEQFRGYGIKTAFCQASLPEKITPYDCRGGF